MGGAAATAAQATDGQVASIALAKFIHSFHKYLLSPCCVPCTVLGTKETSEQGRQDIPSYGADIRQQSVTVR